jgi:hypothetical protein
MQVTRFEQKDGNIVGISPNAERLDFSLLSFGMPRESWEELRSQFGAGHSNGLVHS